MKKKLFCISVVLLLLTIKQFPAYGQTPDFEGGWILEKIELFQKEGHAYKLVDYSESMFVNNQVYKEITFENDQCEVKVAGLSSFLGKYDLKDNQLYLFVKPLKDVFDIERDSEGQMILTRIFPYVNQDDSLQQALDYKIKLTYQKK